MPLLSSQKAECLKILEKKAEFTAEQSGYITVRRSKKYLPLMGNHKLPQKIHKRKDIQVVSVGHWLIQK